MFPNLINTSSQSGAYSICSLSCQNTAWRQQGKHSLTGIWHNTCFCSTRSLVYHDLHEPTCIHGKQDLIRETLSLSWKWTCCFSKIPCRELSKFSFNTSREWAASFDSLFYWWIVSTVGHSFLNLTHKDLSESVLYTEPSWSMMRDAGVVSSHPDLIWNHFITHYIIFCLKYVWPC